MNVQKDAITQYEFDQLEVQHLKEMFQDPVLLAYLRSSYAQMQESILATVQVVSPTIGIDSEKRADLALSFLGGADEYLSQILRIGD